MAEPESVLINTSKEGLWRECDFLVRILFNIIIYCIVLLHWYMSLVYAYQENHKNTLRNSKPFILLLGFPVKNMIHQTAQNTLFFYSHLQVIKSLKQTLQSET
jgi:hypothetical protein